MTTLPRDQAIALVDTCRAVEQLMTTHRLPALAGVDYHGATITITLPAERRRQWRRALNTAPNLTVTRDGANRIQVGLRPGAVTR